MIRKLMIETDASEKGGRLRSQIILPGERERERERERGRRKKIQQIASCQTRSVMTDCFDFGGGFLPFFTSTSDQNDFEGETKEKAF